MSSSWAQLRALVALRWRMVRSRRQRVGLAALGGLALMIVILAVAAGRLVPHDRSFNATLVAPTAFLAYAALALIGPLAAGGGNELFPADDLVPHPVRASTTYFASVVLTPLNIAWVGETTALMSLSAYVTGQRIGTLSALALAAMFIAAMTTCGQAVAWAMTGVRQTEWGIRLIAAIAVLVGAVLVWVAHAGLTSVLDRAPTRWVIVAMLQGAAGDYHLWIPTAVVLLALAMGGLALGARATAYTLRRPPGPAARQQARALRRRSPAPTVGRQLRAIDRASVWRAPALRRGILVMGVLPGAATAAASVEWSALALTGGLVTAGAGLLFGVNAFCLDAGGALWLASCPVAPRDQIRAKAVVLVEVCLACSVIAVLAGAARARGHLTAVDVVTVSSNIAACTAAVVAICLRSSVLRPHRAEMRSTRATPAPPGAMAAQSARLATQTTFIGLAVTGVALTGSPAAPLLLALAIVLWTGASALRSMRRYDDPSIRSKVAITVASG